MTISAVVTLLYTSLGTKYHIKLLAKRATSPIEFPLKKAGMPMGIPAFRFIATSRRNVYVLCFKRIRSNLQWLVLCKHSVGHPTTREQQHQTKSHKEQEKAIVKW